MFEKHVNQDILCTVLINLAYPNVPRTFMRMNSIELVLNVITYVENAKFLALTVHSAMSPCTCIKIIVKRTVYLVRKLFIKIIK